MSSAIDEKWIGLALAISSSMAIGMSSIITKKGLNASGDNASDTYTYLKNPIWWAGMFTLFLGEVANFAAYTFAPPILVTPLGALSVLIGAILASFLLNEHLGHLGRLGCTLSLLGSLIIVLHAPEDKPISTITEILSYASQPIFLLYVFFAIVYITFAIFYLCPRYGQKNPIVYISVCSIVGSISVMAIKAFGIAVKLTFKGSNQFVYPSTWAVGIVGAGCILMQLVYLNKALDRFSVNIVNLIYYVFFTTSTILASVILFQGFNTTDVTNIISLLSGFAVILLGVYVLNLSRENKAGNLGQPDVLRNSLDGWGTSGRPSQTWRTPTRRRGDDEERIMLNSFAIGEDEDEGVQCPPTPRRSEDMTRTSIQIPTRGNRPL
ncbi:hypothetical protein E1B28_010997 [Marasmius oreades]|uniref:DUF803-domain-containing protein n=1 Tax=Marasmius oreades TaxID=181124 RepID=A0A9P7URL4_9AGAR|nr:uncharacterized protein E1B28_010997 [Marasmius oreades]KAG7089299.1 hypothetical protein E1B28_010997 [Marasmius oreades]